MKKFTAIVALLILVAAGCASPAATPTPTPTATSVPVATFTATATPVRTPTFAASPTPARPDSYDFGAFARNIQVAVSNRDVGTLVALTRESEIDCRRITEPGPSCPEESLGKVRHGIPIGPWRSQYSLNTIEEYRRLLTDFFAKTQDGAVDRYGSGAPQVFGIGYPSPREEERDAIVTAIGPGPEERRVLLLRCEYRQGNWAIAAVVIANLPTIEEDSTGERAIYDLERW